MSMPSSLKTELGFNKWQPNDVVKIEDFTADNELTEQLIKEEQDKAAELREMAQIEDVDNVKTYKHHTKFQNGHIIDVYEEVTE
jgi:hypothetical protein